MTLEIKPITTPFIFRITVNCYLIKTDNGFVLIDTAQARNRATVQKELNNAGCQPGNLNLIVLTHGDFDHCGNAAFLRTEYKTKVVMHVADCGMVERGDMFWNRKQPNRVMSIFTPLLFRLSPANRFTPDLYVKEGDDLGEFGIHAEIIELPGHSKGSIGLLTENGDLFCGDLLGNLGKPEIWSLIDDREAAKASVEKLKGKAINRVYPGHGRPFPMMEFLKNYKTETA